MIGRVRRKNDRLRLADTIWVSPPDLPWQQPSPGHLFVPAMQTTSTRRHKCRRPMIEIDYYGEQLKGCPDCNVWIKADGTRRKIAEHDILALKAKMEQPSRGRVH